MNVKKSISCLTSKYDRNLAAPVTYSEEHAIVYLNKEPNDNRIGIHLKEKRFVFQHYLYIHRRYT